MGIKKYILVAFVLGLFSVFIQTIFLRELFAVYGFSELLLSVLLFFWLLWGATGSLTFRKGSPEISLAIYAILGMLVPILIRSTALIFRPMFGLATPFWNIFAAGFFCSFLTLFAGRTFASLSKEYAPAKLYALEGLGALTGGVLSALVIGLINPIFALWALLFIAAFIVFESNVRKVTIFVSLATLAVVVHFAVMPQANSVLWKGFSLSEIESHQGRIMILQREGEKYFFENGRLVFSTGDTLSAEQIVHPLLWAHAEPKYVILVGGIFSGAIRDIKKHSPNKISILYSDIDMFKTASDSIPQFANSLTDEVKLTHSEPKRFLLSNPDNADVIIVLPGFPATGADNRFWAYEFFSAAKRALKSDGIIGAALPVGANMLSQYQLELVASIWKTFTQVFPDGEIYFLDGIVLMASAKAGKLNLKERLLSGNLRPVSAATVPVGYLPILFQSQRTETLFRQLNSARFANINHDWKPLVYLWGILQQAALADVEITMPFIRIVKYSLAAVIILVLATIVGIKACRKKISLLLVLLGGFWGMISQYMFLLLLQANFGNLYWLLGIATGAFLFGSAIGSFWQTMMAKKKRFLQIIGPIVILAIIIALTALGSAGNAMQLSLFFLLFILCGVVSGSAFGISIMSGVPGKSAYASDLLGAAAGAIFAVLIVPLSSPIVIAGFMGSALILATVATLLKD